MKVVLATGIYPPDIGGPATYVAALAGALRSAGHDVVVITYGEGVQTETEADRRLVVRVSKSGGPLLRWRRYAKALQAHGKDADIVYAFSSVSAGVPLVLARLRKPKKMLRLGGDFFWERYSARGGMKSLRDWYAAKPLSRPHMQWLLMQFDHLVFSTRFQQDIYKQFYKLLPASSVLENAISRREQVTLHSAHEPFRALFMGRFVGFKNLAALIEAVSTLPNVRLTLVGDGPLKTQLQAMVDSHQLYDRVIFVTSVHGDEKWEMFAQHDALVIPSTTEISPNVALEARSVGLPVLLSEATGLSDTLSQGMRRALLRTAEDIAGALSDCMQQYDQYAQAAAEPVQERSWDAVAADHLDLFHKLLS